jgi:Fibronectin type III domain
MRPSRLQQLIAVLSLGFAVAARADITLAWGAATGATITNYTVYWGTTSGVYTYQLAVATQTSITVTGLLPNVPCYFTVQATDSGGSQSPFSNEIIYTNVVATPPTPTLPGGGSTVTNGGSGSTSGTSNLPVYVGTGTSSGSGSGGSGGSSGTASMSEYPIQGVPPILTLSVSNNLPLLNISATVGAMLSIQSSTNPLNPDTWATITNLSITNASPSSGVGPPFTIAQAFTPGQQNYQVVDTTPPPNEYYRVVMPYDYMVLADSVLSAQGQPSRLVMVAMPGVSSADVCYITPQSGFLFYDQNNNAFALNSSGATIRQVATTLSSALGQNWTTASEFAFSNGVSSVLATVVATESASSDPVAGASTPIITIDF